MFPTVKVVYCSEASSIVICQNPAFKSKQEKYPAPTRLLIASCIHGVGKILSWFLHSTYKSWCRSTELCLSSTLVQKHCTTGSGLGKCTHFQHFFYMRTNIIYHRWRDSPEPLFEGFIISDVLPDWYSPTPQVLRKRCHGTQLVGYVWQFDSEVTMLQARQVQLLEECLLSLLNWYLRPLDPLHFIQLL